MSIRVWETVEKEQQKLEKGINFEKYSLKFWKKIEEYAERLRGNYKIIEKMFKKLGVNYEWICVNFTNTKNSLYTISAFLMWYIDINIPNIDISIFHPISILSISFDIVSITTFQ